MGRWKSLFAYLILFACTFGVYSNNFNHEFHFDEFEGLVNNRFIRSFAYIPRYFVDVSTLTNLKSHADYRPVLLISYAFNYWLSGYSMWSWHLVQIVLHFACAAFLYLFANQFVRAETSCYLKKAPFLAALFLCVHPYAAGVVNYIWARSSLLTAAFLMAAFAFYSIGKNRRVYFISALITYTLALFTKVEAVAGAGVFVLLDLYFDGTWRKSYRRWIPIMLITLCYLGIRNHAYTSEILQGAGRSDLSWQVYAMTQVTTWWHYVLRWFAPVSLVADNLAYQVVRTPGDGRFLLALGGWGIVLVVLSLLWRTRANVVVLLVSGLLLLVPTSSIIPLAEVVNEHRPYLALALMSTGWVFLFVEAFERSGRSIALIKTATTFGIVLMMAGLTKLTWERNFVFRNDESFWADVVKKAPSGRAYNNYGLVFLKKGELPKALGYFMAAAEMSPAWSVPKINLGLVHEKLGNRSVAGMQFDLAVQLEKQSGLALHYRADFLARQKQIPQAINDLIASAERVSDPCPLYQEALKLSAGEPRVIALAEKSCTDRAPVASRSIPRKSTVLDPRSS